MKNIVLFGPPGSGKGTQASNIIAKYKLVHLSTGDMLRAEIAAQTQLGMEAKTLMDKGELVPDAVVIGMIENQIDANPKAAGFVFDGFPRTVAQAQALDGLLAKRRMPIQKVLSLKVSEEELTKRILERGKTSGRADDQNEEIVKNRVIEYRNKTQPLAIYYAQQRKLVEIPGEGTIEHISDLLNYEIDNIVEKPLQPQAAMTKTVVSIPGPVAAPKETAPVKKEEPKPTPAPAKKPEAKKEPAKRAEVKKAAPKPAAPAKKAAAPKPAAKKKAPAKKAVAKKAAPKKAVKKVAAKKASPKKAAPKKAVKKAPIKKAVAKKAVKNAPAKKVAPKKAIKKAAPKKAVAKKAVKKAPAKKVAPKKAVKKAAPKKKVVAKKVAKKAAPKKAVKKIAPKKAAKKAPIKKKGKK
jgi:adenylate kinase